MEKESRLLLVQVDSVSGEVLGFAVDKIMELGAYNVQLISTLTKKNRPGNIMLIDIDVALEERINIFLGKELKISGYHRISTQHIFTTVSFVDRTVHVEWNGTRKSLHCRFKIIGEPAEPVAVDVEHDFLVKVQQTVNGNAEVYASLDELRQRIESAFREDRAHDITITL